MSSVSLLLLLSFHLLTFFFFLFSQFPIFASVFVVFSYSFFPVPFEPVSNLLGQLTVSSFSSAVSFFQNTKRGGGARGAMGGGAKGILGDALNEPFGPVF